MTKFVFGMGIALINHWRYIKKYFAPEYVLDNDRNKWGTVEPPMSRLQKKILLFNTPEHDNVGDHLITLSEMDFLKTHFNDYEIYEITDIEYTWYHSAIKSRVGVDDIILITGGGFLGSLWLYNGENNVRRILQEYPCNRIIILPQTIYFEENARGKMELKKTIDIYSQHKIRLVMH